MQVNTNYSLTSLWGTPKSGTGTSTATVRLVSRTDGSTFGPATDVSVNENAPNITGFTDYTALGSSGLWQFDLTGVLNATPTGLGEATVSADQQKAEEKAVALAYEYIDQLQYDSARKLLQSVLDQNARNSAALRALGYVSIGEGDYQGAEELFLKAHAINPSLGYDSDAQIARILQKDDPSVLVAARGMLATTSQRKAGRQLLIALTERSPRNTAAHMLLGETLLKQGDTLNGLMQYSSAITNADTGELSQLASRFERMASEKPGSAFVQQLLGKVQLRQGDYDAALETLTHATQIAEDPTPYQATLAQAYIGRGRAKLTSRDIPGAMADFTQAQTLDPTGRDTKAAVAEGRVAQAEEYSRRGDYRAAKDAYRALGELLAENRNQALKTRAAAGAYAVGRALERRRIAAGAEIDSEVTVFQTAYDLDPENKTYKRKLAETRNAIGDQLYATGKYQEAAQSYNRARELYKYDKTYKANTINAFVKYGDERAANLNYGDAIEAYRQAYLVDTYNAEVKQKLATQYNARGLDYVSWEKYKLAALDFKEALRLFPGNAEYQANYNRYSAWDTTNDEE
ncbi:MAG TPA: tetratricopeptide repeat protein [Phycisphaerae bacterium]|mgnify:CR=1 FL=1|nr:tetratricopeptide repeat protein [Phycisphaerae bacterium]